MGGRRRRRRIELTEDWGQLALLCRWPEQLAYEEIRPLTLFGSPVAERARETGAGERTLYRKLARFEELGRAFFSARFVRVLDSLGYARFRHWRLYGEEALAGREAALWLASESLTVEHAGEPLSRYAVEVEAATGRLRSVARPRLFGSPRVLTQPRLFALDALGDGGWLKALRLEGYAPRSPRRPEGLQQALFAYHEAWG